MNRERRRHGPGLCVRVREWSTRAKQHELADEGSEGGLQLIELKAAGNGLISSGGALI